MAEPKTTRQETTLRDFLNVLFRRKWVIIAVVAFASVLVVYLNARQPEIFESNSRILIRRGEQSDILTGSVRTLGWAEEVSSHIETILSEQVFAAAKEIFEDSLAARGLPSGWVFNPGMVRADVLGESNAFIIRYVDFYPTVCELGCQAMTLAFQEYYSSRSALPPLTDFFVAEINDVRAELESLRTQRNEFMNREKYFGSGDESRFYLTKIERIESKLTDLNNEITEQALEVENLRQISKEPAEVIEKDLSFALGFDLVQSAVIRQAKYMLQNLGIKREELLHKYTEQHPEIVAIDQQISELRTELKTEVENTFQIAERALRTLYAQRATFEGELDRAQRELEAIPNKQMALSRLDNKIENLEARHKALLTRQNDSQIATVSRPEWEVTILSNASRAYSKKTRDYVRLALGPFLSLIVGLGLAFFLESLDHSVKNMAEAEEYLNTPVLASISDIRK